MNFNLLITTSFFYVYFTVNCFEWKLKKIVMNRHIVCRVILKLKRYSDLRTRFVCKILPLLLKVNIWIWPSLSQAARCEIMSYIHLKLKIEREKFNKTFSNLNKQINKEKKLLNAGKTKGLIEEHEVPYKTGILFCFSDIFIYFTSRHVMGQNYNCGSPISQCHERFPLTLFPNIIVTGRGQEPKLELFCWKTV